MTVISVYNNKGGVGKSTITVFLSDFFSSTKIAGKKARVAVVDLDSQSSSATSLIGIRAVAAAKSGKRSITHLFKDITNGKKVRFADYLFKREKGRTQSKRLPLAELWVMTQERDSAIDIESECSQQKVVRLFQFLTDTLQKKFDLILFDTPANIDKRNKLTMAALRTSDYIVIPSESSRMAVNAMTDTFNMIQYARAIENKGHPTPQTAGILLNKTDRRTRQYKLHHRELIDIAARHNTTIFKNYFPHAHTLSSASDDSINFPTLREKYNTYYDHVRKAALELAGRCGYKVRPIQK
jgi:chromosome partitioning protein